MRTAYCEELDELSDVDVLTKYDELYDEISDLLGDDSDKLNLLIILEEEVNKRNVI